MRIPIAIDRRFKPETQNQFRKRIRAALRLLNKIALRPADRKILDLLEEIRVTAKIGSGVRLAERRFYLGTGMLQSASLPYLASSILHDSYHVHQYQGRLDGYQVWARTGQLSARAQDQIERGAICFQLRFSKALGLSKTEILHLRNAMRDPSYARIPQKKRSW